AVGGSAGAPEFVGHVLPPGAGGQDEPDHPHRDPVGDPRPPAPGADPRGLGRQVVGDEVVELVRRAGRGHGSASPPTGYTASTQTPCREVVSEPLNIDSIFLGEDQSPPSFGAMRTRPLTPTPSSGGSPSRLTTSARPPARLSPRRPK